MSAQPVDIQIFGRSLRVNCPPDQRDALNQAADDLNQRLQDLKVRTRVTNTEQLVFIAALNISYELTQESEDPRLRGEHGTTYSDATTDHRTGVA